MTIVKTVDVVEHHKIELDRADALSMLTSNASIHERFGIPTEAQINVGGNGKMTIHWHVRTTREE